MGKLRQATLILGEGPTEFFYFRSLCDVFKRLTIKPDYPKHTNIKELDAKITEGVAMGYSHIFCIIDMDTKDKEPERSQYQKLPSPSTNPRKEFTEVEFFETHRSQNYSFSIISATPHVHTTNRNLCSKISTNVSGIERRLISLLRPKDSTATSNAMAVILKKLWPMPIGLWKRN